MIAKEHQVLQQRNRVELDRLAARVSAVEGHTYWLKSWMDGYEIWRNTGNGYGRLRLTTRQTYREARAYLKGVLRERDC